MENISINHKANMQVSMLLYKSYKRINSFFSSMLPDIAFIALWWLVMTRYFFHFQPVKESTLELDAASTNFFSSETALLAYIATLFTISVELFISKKYFNFKSYQKKILAKSFTYVILVIAVILLSNSFLKLQIISFSYENNMSEGIRFFLLGAYMLSVIIIPMNVIRDLAGMLGFRMFVAKIFGYYYAPKEENRIFMFLDMAESTKIAEQLGHVQFSMLIKELVNELSTFIKKSKGTVYQYVGDEVIITWNGNSEQNFYRSISLFYDFENQLEYKRGYYQEKFGVEPKFRASINMGKVTVVEIGVTKKDIVYHGDVLNTAARVQKLCKNYNKDFLACETFVKNLEPMEKYYITPIEQITLEGKEKKEIIHSIEVG